MDAQSHLRDDAAREQWAAGSGRVPSLNLHHQGLGRHGIAALEYQACNRVSELSYADSLRAINRTRGTLLCARLRTTRGGFERMRGLLGHRALEHDEGLLFAGSRTLPVMWMHTLFMRFAIDIVFLDRDGRVVKIDQALPPWRLSSLVFGATHVLELAAGAAQRTQTELSDRIVIERA